MRTGHPAVMPSAITEAGKTARGWIEEQVRSNKNSAEVPAPHLTKVSSHLYCPQSLVIPVLSAVSGHLLYCVRSLWSSPVLSAVSGHPLYCPQSLVISCTVSAVH
ncbi:unnamed protein product [Staurois parvus]|uniref:Uncharacterized protein n=1 Tax=Staurois parvus TaxID=386267 RepID=A0ABN9GZ23_9NEOB|nr:unnamed protein product [Staurois parvus]